MPAALAGPSDVSVTADIPLEPLLPPPRLSGDTSVRTSTQIDYPGAAVALLPLWRESSALLQAASANLKIDNSPASFTSLITWLFTGMEGKIESEVFT